MRNKRLTRMAALILAVLMVLGTLQLPVLAGAYGSGQGYNNVYVSTAEADETTEASTDEAIDETTDETTDEASNEVVETPTEADVTEDEATGSNIPSDNTLEPTDEQGLLAAQDAYIPIRSLANGDMQVPTGLIPVPVETFEELETAILTASGEVYVQLANPITMQRTIVIPNGVHVYLSSVGYDISHPLYMRLTVSSRHFTVLEEAALSLGHVALTRDLDTSSMLYFEGMSGIDMLDFRGGGVLSYGSLFMYNHSSISNNMQRFGGGVLAHGLFEMHGGEVRNNRAHVMPGGDGHGGGIVVGSGSEFIMTNGYVAYNRAWVDGGGILGVSWRSLSGPYVTFGPPPVIRITGGYIRGNVTGRNGAGIAALHGSELHLSGTAVVEDNNIFFRNLLNLPRHGAGVFVQGTTVRGRLTISDDVRISGNRAAAGYGVMGAGVAISHACFEMTGGEISGNIASDGVHWQGDGGGIFAAGGIWDFVIDGGIIDGNEAEGNGGGIYIRTMLPPASILVNPMLDNLYHGLPFDHDYMLPELTCNFLFSEGYEATTGFGNSGQIPIQAQSDLVLEPGIRFISGEITNNTSHSLGGGIHIDSGSAHGMNPFTMEGGTIAGNTAQSGGGVYVTNVPFAAQFSNQGAFNMAGGNITRNEADYGGGIYIYGFDQPTRTVITEISGGTISYNTATYDGGGIWNSMMDYNDPLQIPRAYSNLNVGEEVVFQGNTAGNGAFLPPSNWEITPIEQTVSTSYADHPLNNYDINYNRDRETLTPPPPPPPRPATAITEVRSVPTDGTDPTDWHRYNWESGDEWLNLIPYAPIQYRFTWYNDTGRMANLESAMIPIPKYGEYTILLHPDLYGDWLDMGIEEIIALQKSPFGFSLDLAAPAETTVEVPDEFVLPPEWGGWWTEDMGLAALFIPGYIIGNGPIEEWVEAYEWDAIADPSQINLAVLEGARLPLPPGAKITVTLNLTLSDTHEARDVAGAENSYGVLSMGGTEGLGGLAGWLIPTNPVAMRMWQYVDFYYNYDNEGDARFAEQAVAHSATATTPTPSPTREGYTFMGWYTDEAGTVPFDFTTPITENVQLYARWADEVPVRFLYNDGRNSGITALNDDPLAYYTFYLTSVLRGETVGLPTLGAPTREGYTFVDWYVDRETTQLYDFDTPVTAYLQLFARWAVIPPTCNCTCEDCCDCGDNCTCEEPNDCCDCQVGGGGGGNGDNDDPPAPDMIKNPDRHLVSVGDLVNWTLQGFHNRSGEAVSGFTIVDVPGRGLNFEAGRLPAFTRGEGITYDILYTVYGSDEVFVHETGIDASVPFNFRLPQPGNRYYTSIALYFGDVPAYFGLGDQIIFTFLVVPGAPGNQLINRFWVRYDNVDREGDNNNSIVVPPGGGTPGQPGAPGDTPGGTPGTGMPAPAPGSPSLPWPVGPGSQGGLNNQRPTDYLYVAYDEEPTMVSVLPIPTSPIHHAYMIGFAEDGTIRPQANITRAETATIFFRLTGDAHRAGIWSQQNTFADVELSRWFNNPVSTMQNAGLFAGIPLGDTFAPNQAATRAEFAAMVVNYLGLGHYQVTGGHHFSDIDGHWASNAINVAYMQGWVNGFGDGTFRPDQLITRAEVAALVNRALGRLPETADDLLPGMQLWPDNMNQSAWYYLYIQEATNSNLHELKEDGVHKTWTQLVSPRNWRALERPYSSPWDISN